MIFEPSRDGQYGPGYYLTANLMLRPTSMQKKRRQTRCVKQVEAQNLSEDDEIMLACETSMSFSHASKFKCSVVSIKTPR